MSMSDQIEVPYGDNPSETAQNLLGAAARLGHAPYVIESTSRGVFLVPEDVAKEAGDYLDRDDDAPADGEKPLDKLKAGELDELAAAESIDLEGAKTSKATRIARIKEVRAQRKADEKQVESLAAGETAADEDPQDDDSNPAGDDEDQE